MVLNTIVAEALDGISDTLEKLDAAGFNAGLQELLKKEISAHRRVIFNGDGYTKEWPKEAEKRGLPNLADTPAAIKPLRDKGNKKLFEKYGVLSEAEMESRYMVFLEDYERRLDIEGRIALEIAKSMIRPVAMKEYLKLDAPKECPSIGEARKEMGEAIETMSRQIKALEKALEKEDGIIPAMTALRAAVDKLESIIDDDLWPLPKYREMLFIC